MSKDYIDKGNDMKRLTLLTSAAVVALLCTPIVYAKPAMCHIKDGNPKQMKVIFEQLDLTPEQRILVKENRKEMYASMKDTYCKHASIDHRASMMGEFVSAKGFDKEAFMKEAMQNAEKRAQYRADRFEKMISILTPEQREKLAMLLKEKQK